MSGFITTRCFQIQKKGTGQGAECGRAGGGVLGQERHPVQRDWELCGVGWGGGAGPTTSPPLDLPASVRRGRGPFWGDPQCQGQGRGERGGGLGPGPALPQAVCGSDWGGACARVRSPPRTGEGVAGTGPPPTLQLLLWGDQCLKSKSPPHSMTEVTRDAGGPRERAEGREERTGAVGPASRVWGPTSGPRPLSPGQHRGGARRWGPVHPPHPGSPQKPNAIDRQKASLHNQS